MDRYCLKREIENLYEWCLDSIPFNRKTGKWLPDCKLMDSGDDYYNVTITFHLVDGTVFSISNNALRCWQEDTLFYSEQLDVCEDYVRINNNEVIPYTAICWIEDKTVDIDWATEISKRLEGGAS